MTILLLIRHGENDIMKTRLAGRLPDVHLNSYGQAQAEKLASALQPVALQAIYSSPMERAIETAAPLSAQKELPVQMHAGLLEVDYGSWQGHTYDQLSQENLWKLVLTAPAQVTFPGGESIVNVQKRSIQTFHEIIEQHSGEFDTIVCFTHGDIIRLASAFWLQMPLSAFHTLQTDTASVTAWHLHQNQTRLLFFNHTGSFPTFSPSGK